MPYKCNKCGHIMTSDVKRKEWKPKECTKCHTPYSKEDFKHLPG